MDSPSEPNFKNYSKSLFLLYSHAIVSQKIHKSSSLERCFKSTHSLSRLTNDSLEYKCTHTQTQHNHSTTSLQSHPHMRLLTAHAAVRFLLRSAALYPPTGPILSGLGGRAVSMTRGGRFCGRPACDDYVTV